MLILLIHCIEAKVKAENVALKQIIHTNLRQLSSGIKTCQSCDHIRAKVDNQIVETCLGQGAICHFCGRYYCCYHVDTLLTFVHKFNKMWNCGPVCSGNCFVEYSKPERFHRICDFDVVPHDSRH